MRQFYSDVFTSLARSDEMKLFQREISRHQEMHEFGAKISLLKTIGNKIETQGEWGGKTSEDGL